MEEDSLHAQRKLVAALTMASPPSLLYGLAACQLLRLAVFAFKLPAERCHLRARASTRTPCTTTQRLATLAALGRPSVGGRGDLVERHVESGCQLSGRDVLRFD